MTFAFTRAQSSSYLSKEEAEEWLANDAEARQFFRYVSSIAVNLSVFLKLST